MITTPKSKGITQAITVLAALMLSFTTFAKEKASDEPMPIVPKFEYKFKLPETPSKVIVGENVINSIGGKSIYTTRGFKYAELGNRLIDGAISPIIGNCILIADEGRSDGRHQAAVFSMNEEQKKIGEINNKLLGNPLRAIMTPDGRHIILATDEGLHEIDVRQYLVTGRMNIPFDPQLMTISPNAYYLAMADGENLAVFNYEDKVLRKELNFGAPVTSIFFDPESKNMGVMTSDGLLSIYDTRSFDIKSYVDELGDGLGGAFSRDSKYIIALTSPDQLTIVNIVDLEKPRETISLNGAKATQMATIYEPTSMVVTYDDTNAIGARRISKLEPFYGKLIKEGALDDLNEWLKQLPGETAEQYRARVNDETRRAKLREFEDARATEFAGDMLSDAAVSLGKYNRSSGIMELNFANMPSIFLPVPEADLASFGTAADLEFTKARYGVMPNDRFELVYAVVKNHKNGKEYVYNNTERLKMNFLTDDDVVPIELIQQQQMEEIRLQDIRRQVIEEAQNRNVITNHTNITVDSQILPDYDANGKKILNYVVKFSYDVEPEFTIHEDFPPGKYHVDESGAASSMVNLIKQVFSDDFKQYIKPGKKMIAKIYGTADATPIVSKIIYDGAYGDYDNEPVTQNGEKKPLSVKQGERVLENEQLAFLRALGCTDYLKKNVEGLDKLNSDYQYFIEVSPDKGSEHRRITTEITLFDVF